MAKLPSRTGIMLGLVVYVYGMQLVAGGIQGIDLCFTKPFNYTVSLPGCEPQLIQNNFCYGLCRSFFYPKKRRYGFGSMAVCSYCAPVQEESIFVTLKCNAMLTNGLTRKYKIVRIFKKCKCKRSLCKNYPLYY